MLSKFSWLIAKERMSQRESLPPWIRAEHEARYHFAGNHVKNKVVVDCACGSGIGSNFYLKKSPEFLYGFDYDSQAISTAILTNQGLSNASFQRADGNLLPIQTSACDLFISFETVEHIREDLSFIKEAARVLKPDGTFICSTPNRIVSNPGASLTDKPWNPFHVREYSIEELKTLLGHYFKIEECFGQNPNRKWKIELLNWIGKNINKAVPVYLSKLWKLSWLFIEDKTRHKVRGVLPGFHYEYLVVVCKKNRQLLLLLFEQIKNALLTAYHNESSRMFSKIIF